MLLHPLDKARPPPSTRLCKPFSFMVHLTPSTPNCNPGLVCAPSEEQFNSLDNIFIFVSSAEPNRHCPFSIYSDHHHHWPPVHLNLNTCPWMVCEHWFVSCRSPDFIFIAFHSIPNYQTIPAWESLEFILALFQQSPQINSTHPSELRLRL